MLLLAVIVSLAWGTPDSSVVLQSRVEQVVEESLQRQFPADAYRLQARVQRIGGDIGPGTLTVSWPSGNAIPRGLTRIAIAEDDPDGAPKGGWALLYVAHFDSALVAARTVARGDSVPGTALSATWVDVTRMAARPMRPSEYREMAAAGPVFATQHLRQSQFIRGDDLRGPLAVDTGEPVLMTYQQGRIGLRIACKARESGSTGETVRVIATESGVIYRARLTGPGQAMWMETLSRPKSSIR